jgi:hypothetical protein
MPVNASLKNEVEIRYLIGKVEIIERHMHFGEMWLAYGKGKKKTLRKLYIAEVHTSAKVWTSYG